MRVLSALVLSSIALAGTLLPDAPRAGRMLALLLPTHTARADSSTSVILAGGNGHSCAIKNGTLYCWGRNNKGQLGDGTTTGRSTPVTVTNMVGGVTAVATGSTHTCAIKGGVLYCWGENYYGQLGNGTTTNVSTPVTVTNMTSGVTSIAAMLFHSCAIRNGAMYCWGFNAYGQLGASSSQTCGSIACSTTPLTTTNMSTGVTAIAAGADHTCAIRNGALYCWGDGFFGQLGGTGGTSNPVTNMTSSVTAVAAGGSHTCAIRSSALLCWGRNNKGLGDNTTTDRSTPVTVTQMVSNVTALATGASHSCAIRGQVLYCWGDNQYGQVGIGTTFPNYTAPAQVINPGGEALVVAAGYDHTLGLWSTTCLSAWGLNSTGQLGNNNTTSQVAPVQVSGGCGWGPLGTFNKATPVNGAVSQPFSLMLGWGAPGGTVNHYRYCYATTPGCTPATQVPSTTLSATISGLSPATTYRWQVRACAESDCNIFSDANDGASWTFSTQGGISFINTAGPAGTRKEAMPTATRMGELITYTIVVSNAGSALVSAQITDTLATSATLVSATPGYTQIGQALVWQNVVVPAGGTATLTITVRAAGGPLAGGYNLNNAVLIGAQDGQIVRNAPQVAVTPNRAFLPLALR
jgi:uncharacterized repeat protein (TIGR01451 family)